MNRLSVIVTVLLLSLASCQGQPEHAASQKLSPLAGSWLQQITSSPQDFSSLVDASSRDGWIAFHRNDFTSASSSFKGEDASTRLARGRALWELSLFYDDAARVSELAWASTFSTWKERSAIPAGSSIPYVAGLAALDSGDLQSARNWLAISAESTNPFLAQASLQLASVESLEAPFQGQDLPPLIARVNQHLRARSTGALSPIMKSAHEPLVEERVPNEKTGTFVVHRLYDPMLCRTLSMGFRIKASMALGLDDPLHAVTHPTPEADPLAALLFSPAPNLHDLRAEGTRAISAPGTLGAMSPTLAQLGLVLELPREDDANWAREQLRLLDSALDQWVVEHKTSLDSDGLALLLDLKLPELFRSRVLLAMARRCMLADHPRQALAFAYLGLDLESPRALTAVNHPGLQALIMEGQLRTGHTREALDALQILLPAYPALTGLNEVLGDLAILQGLDRFGDSKEN